MKPASGSTSAPAPARGDEDEAARVVESKMLLGGRTQLAILHNKTIYFLRETRFGKLILTK